MTDTQTTPTPAAEENFADEIRTDHYELLYILSANFTADEIKPMIEKISNLIKTHEGKITLESDLGKQKLAYPIQLASHGYYQLFEFDLPTQALAEINKQLKLMPEVVRFLIVTKKIKTAQEISDEKELQTKLAKKKEEAIEKIKSDKEETKEKPAKKEIKQKMSLEDLDKKLEEILDTNDIV